MGYADAIQIRPLIMQAQAAEPVTVGKWAEYMQANGSVIVEASSKFPDLIAIGLPLNLIANLRDAFP